MQNYNFLKTKHEMNASLIENSRHEVFNLNLPTLFCKLDRFINVNNFEIDSWAYLFSTLEGS